jgi:hypothetical protein
MPTRLMTLNGVPKGLYKTYDKVTLALIYKAGHMAPRDQPELSLCMFHTPILILIGMMDRFIRGLPFNETCAKEPCLPVECPNKCSEHGTCNAKGVCECEKGFQGEDCSIGNSYSSTYTLSAVQEVAFGKRHKFSGYIFGNNIHQYHLSGFGEMSIGQYDVKIRLSQLM